jgi:hypothetical protein
MRHASIRAALEKDPALVKAVGPSRTRGTHNVRHAQRALSPSPPPPLPRTPAAPRRALVPELRRSAAEQLLAVAAAPALLQALEGPRELAALWRLAEPAWCGGGGGARAWRGGLPPRPVPASAAGPQPGRRAWPAAPSSMRAMGTQPSRPPPQRSDAADGGGGGGSEGSLFELQLPAAALALLFAACARSAAALEWLTGGDGG